MKHRWFVAVVAIAVLATIPEIVIFPALAQATPAARRTDGVAAWNTAERRVVVVEHTAGRTASLPWATWATLADDVVAVDESRCGTVRVLVVAARRNGAEYVFWHAPANGAVVVAVFPRSEVPSSVGTGRVDPKRPERIPPLAWVDYDPVLHAGGPCAFLNPLDA